MESNQVLNQEQSNSSINESISNGINEAAEALISLAEPKGDIQDDKKSDNQIQEVKEINKNEDNELQEKEKEKDEAVESSNNLENLNSEKKGEIITTESNLEDTKNIDNDIKEVNLIQNQTENLVKVEPLSESSQLDPTSNRAESELDSSQANQPTSLTSSQTLLPVEINIPSTTPNSTFNSFQPTTTQTTTNLSYSNNLKTNIEQVTELKMDLSSVETNTLPTVYKHPSLLKDERSIAGVKRDRNAAEFIGLMDHYVPIIPDVVVSHYLTRSGFDCEDRRVKRLLGVSAQKFLTDISIDAYQYTKIRTQTGGNRKSKNKKTSLAVEDLSSALSEYGINVKKPDYYI